MKNNKLQFWTFEAIKLKKETRLKAGITGLLLTTVLTIVATMPSLANPPVVNTLDVSYPIYDPCNDEQTLQHIIFTFYDHFHEGRFVGHNQREAWTDNGYEMIAGNETFVLNDKIVHGRFNDVYKAADGRVMHWKAMFVFDLSDGTFVVDRPPSVECLAGSTL